VGHGLRTPAEAKGFPVDYVMSLNGSLQFGVVYVSGCQNNDTKLEKELRF
jgi:hypothetical protein